MKRYLLLILFFHCLLSQGQSVMEEDLNRYNDSGRKTGLWIEYPLKGRRTEIYYQDGVEHGLFRIYDNDQLSLMGELDHGILCGSYFSFKNQFLMSKVDHIRQIRKEDNGSVWQRGRFVGYYPSGIICEEGDLIWDSESDPLNDFGIQVGEWKFYGEDGHILMRKEFPEKSASEGSTSIYSP